MKIYRNYCVRLDLEGEEEIRRLAYLIQYGITLSEMKKGFYLTETTIAFGKELLQALNLGKEENNENN